MAATRTLPERLVRCRMLHTPKGRRAVVDLHAHRRLLTRPAAPSDIADLAQAWTHAGNSAAAAVQLDHVLSAQVDHPLHTLTPVERTL